VDDTKALTRSSVGVFGQILQKQIYIKYKPLSRILLSILKILIPYRNITFIIKTDEETFINILNERTRKKFIDPEKKYVFVGIINEEKKCFNLNRDTPTANKSGFDFPGKYHTNENTIVETKMKISIKFFISAIIISFVLCLFAGYTAIMNKYFIIGWIAFIYFIINTSFLLDVYLTKKKFAHIYTVRGYEVEIIENGFKNLIFKN
jgi:hypothetical protein